MFQMQIYHPMYRPSLTMETTNNLAKLLCGIDSLVIAKMNGGTNWHPRAKVRIASLLLGFLCLPQASFKTTYVDLFCETHYTTLTYACVHSLL